MGSGASTPVYPQKITAPTNRQYYQRVSIGQPLHPRYKSTFEDSITVANQERIYKSPRHIMHKQQMLREPIMLNKSLRRGGTPRAIVLNTSETRPMVLNKSSPVDYLAAGNGGNSRSAVSGLTTRTNSRLRSDYINQEEDDEFVLKQVEEFVLQDNGKYRLQKSANCLIRSKSDILKQQDLLDHPFAPTSSRQSITSDEYARHRNNINQNYRSGSSGYSSLSSTGTKPSLTKKSPTGRMLHRVVRVLEAQPPQFLLIPEKPNHRPPSPTPTIMSSVGTNTIPVPPNTGEGGRAEKFMHSKSSPDLYSERRKMVQAVNTQNSPTKSISNNSRTQKWLEPPSVVKPSRYAGGFHSYCLSKNNNSPSPDRVEQNYLSSSNNLDISYSPDRPPHLTPSPNKQRGRRKSTGSMLSVSPIGRSSSSLSSTSSKNNIKVNSLGLVYI